MKSDDQVPSSRRELIIESSCKTETAFTKAEIIWTLKSTIDGFLVRSNDHINDTFAVMFPDSDIA